MAGRAQNAGGSGRVASSTLFIRSSQVDTAIGFYVSVFDAVDLGQARDPRNVPSRKLDILNGSKYIYIAVVEDDTDSYCLTYGSVGSERHLAGNAHGMIIAYCSDLREVAEKATRNGGTSRIGKVSGSEDLYTVVTDPVGFFWSVRSQ